VPPASRLHSKSGDATIGLRWCYYRLTIVLHFLVDSVATIFRTEVLQTVDGDATNCGSICFQQCVMLLLARIMIFLDFADISVDFA
jgi:hypothetical protein